MARGDPMVRIRVPKDLKLFVETEAERRGCTQNSVIVYALREFAERRAASPLPPVSPTLTKPATPGKTEIDAMTKAAIAADRPDWDHMTNEERHREARHTLRMLSLQGPTEAPAFGLGTLATLLFKDISYENVLGPRERLAVTTAATHYAEAARQVALAWSALDEADLT